MKNVYQHVQRAGLDTAAMTLVGFAAGCGIARLGSGATPRSQHFIDTPEFAIWSAVVGFEIALRLNLFSALWIIRAEIRSRVGVGCVWTSFVAILIVAGIFRIAEFIYPTIHSGLHGNGLRRMLLHLSMLITLAPGLVSLWRIRWWISRAHVADTLERPDSPQAGQLISDVLYFNRTLQKILLMISAVVVVSIVDVAAFRIAYLAQAPKTSVFPVGLVVLYGLLLTVVLSFLYLPVYSGFNEYKRQLRDALCPVPAVGVPDEAWHGNRDRTERLLQLPRGPWESLRTNYAVLTPLIASVFSLFLPGIRF
ncbi:hypothetical protein ACFY36_41355 [Actinoplanes sp. NPDC000266]